MGALLLATSDHLVDAGSFAVQFVIIFAGTVVAALVWTQRRPGNRLGILLLALAAALAMVPLQGASNPVLHSVGVLADPFVTLLGFLAVFAFPSGYISGRAERVVLAGWALYLPVAFVPWFFFSPVISGGAPLAGCNDACPANGLMIADRPEVAAGLGTGVSWFVIGLATATIACLVFRLITASRPRRRTLLPVYVPALMLTFPLLVFHGFAAGVLHLEPDTLRTVGWSVTIGRTALSLGFLLAILQANLFAGTALRRLMGQIGSGLDASRLRAIVADALDDPTVEIVLPAAVSRDGRATSLIERPGQAVGAIWHDPALTTDPELLAAASHAVLLALENGRLAAELRTSRAQTADAADAARRGVERDLHDGLQQHLVALQIKLAMTQELVDRDSEVAARLTDVGDRLQDAMSELRDLARGVRPPLLRDHGLPAALSSATQRLPKPAALVADGLARYSDGVETAVYYCCVESLQNVGKHAGADARAEVRVSEQAEELCFEISDDGVGWEVDSTRGAGAGLMNMRERVAALNGTLTVESAAGRGTHVRGRIPLTAPR